MDDGESPQLAEKALNKIQHLSKHRREVLEALAEFDEDHFKSRCKKTQQGKDDILIFKVEKNAVRAPTHALYCARGANKS